MRVINGKQRMCATVIRERELSDVEGHNMATHPYPKHRNTEVQKYRNTAGIVRHGRTQHSSPPLSQIQKHRNTEIQRELSDMEGHHIATHPHH